MIGWLAVPAFALTLDEVRLRAAEQAIEVERARASAQIADTVAWDITAGALPSVVAFAKEMTESHADWQVHAYGNTVHAFTNPAANDRAFGTLYDARADRRAWESTINFLRECFA